MAGRLEFENSSSYGEISSSTIRSLSHRQEIITRHLSTDAPRNNENPPSLSCGSPDKVSGDGSTWAQL